MSTPVGVGCTPEAGPHRTPASDAQLDDLVSRARRGDEAAFSELYRKLHPRLLAYLNARVGAEAADVASETWLRVVMGLNSFRGNGEGFTAWLFTIARHRAIDALRRRRPDEPWTPDLDAASTIDVEQLVLDRVSISELLAKIETLPADQADSITLRYVADLDIATVASILGKTPTAVRVNTHRGLRRLAQQFLANGAAA